MLLSQLIIGALTNATGICASLFECTGDRQQHTSSACSCELEHEGKRKSVTFSKVLCGQQNIPCRGPVWLLCHWDLGFITFITGKEFAELCESNILVRSCSPILGSSLVQFMFRKLKSRGKCLLSDSVRTATRPTTVPAHCQVGGG